MLSPVHVVSDIKADDEDTDDVAVYAAMDEPDDNPPDVAPPKVRLVRTPSSRDLRVPSTFKNALAVAVDRCAEELGY